MPASHHFLIYPTNEQMSFLMSDIIYVKISKFIYRLISIILYQIKHTNANSSDQTSRSYVSRPSRASVYAIPYSKDSKYHALDSLGFYEPWNLA